MGPKIVKKWMVMGHAMQFR